MFHISRHFAPVQVVFDYAAQSSLFDFAILIIFHTALESMATTVLTECWL